MLHFYFLLYSEISKILPFIVFTFFFILFFLTSKTTFFYSFNEMFTNICIVEPFVIDSTFDTNKEKNKKLNQFVGQLVVFSIFWFYLIFLTYSLPHLTPSCSAFYYVQRKRSNFFGLYFSNFFFKEQNGLLLFLMKLFLAQRVQKGKYSFEIDI